MENINIAELLKDCPSDMELNCTMYEDVYFDYVDELQIIHCYIQRDFCKTSITFNQYGTPNSDMKSKCVIFPKGKTTWDGFQGPFKDGDKIHLWTIQDAKDGDVISYDDGWTCIFKNIHGTWYSSYCFITDDGDFYTGYERHAVNSTIYGNVHPATKEQCNLLFQKIKEAGYKWNPETKTLEKLKKDKFNISALKPFDKVLVRDSFSEPWNINYFSYIDSAKMFKTIMGTYLQCIPYEGNEYLLGTFGDCNDYYKTWK